MYQLQISWKLASGMLYQFLTKKSFPSSATKLDNSSKEHRCSSNKTPTLGSSAIFMAPCSISSEFSKKQISTQLRSSSLVITLIVVTFQSKS